MMARSKTLRSKGRIQMCEISNLQISQIQLATQNDAHATELATQRILSQRTQRQAKDAPEADKV